MLPQEALQELQKGNDRFWQGWATHPHQTYVRRQETLARQQPFAAVLTCSDSRVPPEILFDQGLGDLFVIRTAGNVLDEAVIGSLEYAVDHLQVPLVIVLGHQRCGAVSAALQGGEAPGRIAGIVKKITPAIQAARTQPGDMALNTINANINRIAAELKTCKPILAEHYEKRKVEILGARYDLDSGKVTFFTG